MKKTCNADTRPAPKVAADYLTMFTTDRKPCGKDAVYETMMGPQCHEHGEALVDAAMSDNTPLGMILKAKGQRPATRDEARRKILRAIQ